MIKLCCKHKNFKGTSHRLAPAGIIVPGMPGMPGVKLKVKRQSAKWKMQVIWAKRVKQEPGFARRALISIKNINGSFCCPSGHKSKTINSLGEISIIDLPSIFIFISYGENLNSLKVMTISSLCAWWRVKRKMTGILSAYICVYMSGDLRETFEMDQ